MKVCCLLCCVFLFVLNVMVCLCLFWLVMVLFIVVVFGFVVVVVLWVFEEGCCLMGLYDVDLCVMNCELIVKLVVV